MKQLESFSKGSLLDLACGDGRNAIYFAQMGFDVTAVDFSTVALARLEKFAREANVSVTRIESSLEALSFSKSFHSVILSHFKPETNLLSRIVDWLKPGGTLAVCTFNTLEHLHNGFSMKYCLAPRELIQIDGLETIHYDSFTELSGDETRYLDGYFYLKELTQRI